MDQVGRDREFRGQCGEVAVELRGEQQQVVPLVLEVRDKRSEQRGSLGNAGAQFGDNEVEEGDTIGVRRARQPQDIEVQPAFQQSYVVGECDGLGLLLAGVGELPRPSLNWPALLLGACGDRQSTSSLPPPTSSAAPASPSYSSPARASDSAASSSV